MAGPAATSTGRKQQPQSTQRSQRNKGSRAPRDNFFVSFVFFVVGVSSLVGFLPLEDPARIIHQHRVQLLVGDALSLQIRNNVIMNMEVVPARKESRQRP